MSDISLEISIPADNDGFVLFRCPVCGEYFKLKPSDVEADEVLHVWCPCCGIASKDYITDDVIDLAMKMAENVAMDMIFNEMKKWERQFKGPLTFKVGNRPKPKPEEPIVAGIEALEKERYRCCKREAKIKPTLKYSSSYCPFCGVKKFEVE
nr:TFIIB-type zinc ribbon-containing protein [uncultured Niameybacter sp.]